MLLLQISLLSDDGFDGRQSVRGLPLGIHKGGIAPNTPLIVGESLDHTLKTGGVQLHVEVGFATGGYFGIRIPNDDVSILVYDT